MQYWVGVCSTGSVYAVLGQCTDILYVVADTALMHYCKILFLVFYSQIKNMLKNLQKLRHPSRFINLTSLLRCK